MPTDEIVMQADQEGVLWGKKGLPFSSPHALLE
jgi:hypothetical protein